MMVLGIDDTDVMGSPGTNQFCRRLVRCLADDFCCRLIVRHQLLRDDRVPYTSKNSCASVQLEPLAEASRQQQIESLAGQVRQFIHENFVPGSDPGFCIATGLVPVELTSFGQRCQQNVVSQSAARDVAEASKIHLEGCGGTDDGVIGALAAVGLAVTGNDGRVIQIGTWPDDLSGEHSIQRLHERRVDVVHHDDNKPITSGLVNVGKHLRPNYRDHRVVLFALPSAVPSVWNAVRLP